MRNGSEYTAKTNWDLEEDASTLKKGIEVELFGNGNSGEVTSMNKDHQEWIKGRCWHHTYFEREVVSLLWSTPPAEGSWQSCCIRSLWEGGFVHQILLAVASETLLTSLSMSKDSIPQIVSVSLQKEKRTGTYFMNPCYWKIWIKLCVCFIYFQDGGKNDWDPVILVVNPIEGVFVFCLFHATQVFMRIVHPRWLRASRPL